MANKIILKKSSVAAKVPLSTDLEVGEISVNLQDQKLYSKKSDGTVILVGSGLGGAGDVVGAVSSTDDALVRFNGTNGKTIQNSSVTLDDNGNFNNVNAVGFDTTPGTLPTATGSMFWDTGNGTPSIILDPDVTLQLGQEQLALVYNGTGATITNGKVVAVTGAQGQRPSVALADADSEALSASTLGIATENILNGAEGFVTTFGFVRGLDTSAFTAGAPVYLSQTAGSFTATRPSAPAHTVALGWVIKVSASAGEIFVNINNGWELGELHDVLLSSVADNQALIYNAASSTWKNTTLKTVNGNSLIGSGNIAIPVGDVVGPASATDNAIMRYDGTTGKLAQNSIPIIDDSGNIVTTASLAIGNITSPVRQIHTADPTSSEWVIEQTTGKPDYRKWNILATGGNSTTPPDFILRLLNDAGNAASGNAGFGVNGATGKFSTAPRMIDPASVPAGSIIQAKWVDMGGGSWSAVTSAYANSGFGGTITPQFSTSKIIHIVTVGVVALCDGNVVIARNGTIVSPSLADNFRPIGSWDWYVDMAPLCFTWMDSPGTTSATNYNLYGRATGCGNSIVIGSSSDFTCSWLMLEVAA